jgi:transposase
MTPELSRRLGKALGQHVVTPDERSMVTSAAEQVDTWEQLPALVRALVEEIEARPGPGQPG